MTPAASAGAVDAGPANDGLVAEPPEKTGFLARMPSLIRRHDPLPESRVVLLVLGIGETITDQVADEIHLVGTHAARGHGGGSEANAGGVRYPILRLPP